MTLPLNCFTVFKASDINFMKNVFRNLRFDLLLIHESSSEIVRDRISEARHRIF